MKERLGRSRATQAHYIMNMAKWEVQDFGVNKRAFSLGLLQKKTSSRFTLNSFNNEVYDMTQKLEDLLNMSDSKEIINDDKKKKIKTAVLEQEETMRLMAEFDKITAILRQKA